MPDTPKQTVRVTIFNQSYTLSTSGDQTETEQLAMQVDELMSSIARRAGNLDSTRTAVLACLHLADQLHSLQTRMARLQAAIDSRTKGFSELLDDVLSKT